MDKLEKCEANYVPLTPIAFLKRAAMCYASRTSIIYGHHTRFTWQQTYHRCRRLAASLRSLNIVKNDVVSVLAPNIPALYEMHFAVPMAGAVLNAINTRLDTHTIKTILTHSEPKVFFVDYQYVPIAKDALRLLSTDLSSKSKSHGSSFQLPLVVVIDDIDIPTGVRLGNLEYEQLIQSAASTTSRFVPDNNNDGMPSDEWDPIALNYTSGTTSSPKGVVYSHRGAYLSTLSLILGWEMKTQPVFLWSLPMFHCNGWTFTWGVAARGGTNVCIRNPTAYDMYRSISLHNVTHMCGAPIIFNILIEAKPHERFEIKSKVQMLTGGAPPPPTLLDKIERLGFHVVHAYGLTEATGPALVCEWQDQWNHLSREAQARLKARQGISVLTVADADVKDPKTLESVPRDGKTVGEIVIRGSGIMKGYLKNEEENVKAFEGGWFHTGDVGVMHGDGYIEIKDRLKDVIISGGENISSVEVEQVLFKHPNVVEAAVVAMPHPRWGESPCAFVVTKGGGATEDDIVMFCRKNLPRFMVPKKVVFVTELPKNGNGKVMKQELRTVAKRFEVTKEKEEASRRLSNGGVGLLEQRRNYDDDQGQVLHQNFAMSTSRL